MKKQKKLLPEIITTDTPGYEVAAAAIIKAGGIVAFPTETYYGLGVDPFNNKAVTRLFQLKSRVMSKAILVIIDRLSQLNLLISEFPEPYHPLVKKYWPGPLTLVFPARQTLPESLTGGSGTVGIRMTSSQHAAAICFASGIPISATSANISGENPACCAAEVVDYFSTGVDLVIDGGEATARQGSTIAALTPDQKITILRQGVISIDMELRRQGF